MTRKSYRSFIVRLLLGCLLGISPGIVTGSLAQSDQSLLFIGVNPGVGIGVYNGIGVAGGINLRYQHPLNNNLTLIARTGIESFRIKGRYADYYQQNFQTATGISIPIAGGPRYYFMENLYGGLNLGVEIGANKLSATAFLFEPGVGLVVPLKGGNYLDVGTSIVTSFSRGSGIFAFNIAYGLPFGRF